MASYYQTLVAIRDATAAKLLEAESNPNAMVDYSLDGQSVSYTAYVAGLQQRLEKYTEMIQTANHPFWQVSRGKT